jgi:hypothetical protein
MKSLNKLPPQWMRTNAMIFGEDLLPSNLKRKSNGKLTGRK